MIDFCICGHPRGIHFQGPFTHCTWCRMTKESAWHEFKLDNLKYLEQRYEESVKNGNSR